MTFPRYLITIYLLVGIGFEGGAFGETPLSVETTIAKIREAEAETRAVQVKGFKGQSFMRNGAGEFVPTAKKINGSVILDGMLGGRYVLDRTETLPVGSADSAKFANRVAIESYDGKEGRIIKPPVKFANGRSRDGEAEISNVSPVGLAAYASLCDGSAASLGYFQPFIKVAGSKSPLLGDALAAMVEQGVSLSVSREQIGDVQAVRISDPFGNTYWFDPAKGFRLIQAITKNAFPSRPYRKLFIDRFIQLNAEISYPAKGRWEDCTAKIPGMDDKVEFSVESASLLQDPNFEYKAKIPPGYVVHQLVLGMVFTSTGTVAELNAHLDELTKKAATQTGPLQPSQSPPKGDSASSGKEREVLFLVIAAFAIIAGLATVVIARRRTPSRLILLPLLVIVSLYPKSSLASANHSSETRFNCAVNTTYVALRIFGKNCSLGDLASILNAGDGLVNECSMADIKQAASAYGLDASAGRAENVPFYLQTLPGNYVAIVRLSTANPHIFHFVAIARSNSPKYVWLDPFGSLELAVLQRDDLKAKLSTATGELIVMRAPVPERGAHPMILNSKIDLGAISKTHKPIALTFRVYNSGDKAATITDVKPSCGCIGSPKFDRLAASGQIALIHLVIDPAALPPGAGSREIAIVTDAPNSRVLSGRVVFDLSDDASQKTPSRMFVQPPALTFGKVSAANASNEDHEIVLNLPIDVARYGDSVQVIVDADASVVNVEKIDMAMQSDRTMDMKYAIKLRAGRPGRIDTRIKFNVWNRAQSVFDTAELTVSGLVY